jgi:hypothetical protein
VCPPGAYLGHGNEAEQDDRSENAGDDHRHRQRRRVDDRHGDGDLADQPDDLSPQLTSPK